MNDLDFAPGCFGSPLCYKEGHVNCAPCPFALQCAPIALERLEKLHAHFGVKPKAVRPRKPPKAPKPPVVLAVEPPPKPKRSAKMKQVAGALRARHNPFSATNPAHKSWWLVAQLLIHKPAHASLEALVGLVAKALNSLKAAHGQVQKILVELTLAGAIEKRGDVFAIKEI